ncbi:hypothetical protein D3C72_1496770 [compost metagenome]
MIVNGRLLDLDEVQGAHPGQQLTGDQRADIGFPVVGLAAIAGYPVEVPAQQIAQGDPPGFTHNRIRVGGQLGEFLGQQLDDGFGGYVGPVGQLLRRAFAVDVTHHVPGTSGTITPEAEQQCRVPMVTHVTDNGRLGQALQLGVGELDVMGLAGGHVWLPRWRPDSDQGVRPRSGRSHPLPMRKTGMQCA